MSYAETLGDQQEHDGSHGQRRPGPADSEDPCIIAGQLLEIARATETRASVVAISARQLKHASVNLDRSGRGPSTFRSTYDISRQAPARADTEDR